MLQIAEVRPPPRPQELHAFPGDPLRRQRRLVRAVHQGHRQPRGLVQTRRAGKEPFQNRKSIVLNMQASQFASLPAKAGT